MFNFKKTKIVSTPVEEVLEVKQVPVTKELVAIDFATVEGSVKYIHYGSVTDYDGRTYEFEWDDQQKRLCRLVGSLSSQFIWDSATRVLEEMFSDPETTIESKIEPILEKHYKNLDITLTKGLKALEDKIEKSSTIRPQMISRPEVSSPKPSTVQPSMQNRESIEVPMTSVADDQIALNAMKFLQESQSDDLGIDYLSL